MKKFVLLCVVACGFLVGCTDDTSTKKTPAGSTTKVETSTKTVPADSAKPAK